MVILNVDYVSLTEKLERLSEIYSKLNSLIGQIAEECERLDIFWDGDANAVFIAKTGEDLVDMEIIMLRVKETLKKAGEAMEIYMRNERDIIRLAGEITNKATLSGGR